LPLTLHYADEECQDVLEREEGHISSEAAFTIGAITNFHVFLLAYIFLFFVVNGEKGKNMTMAFDYISKN